MLGGYFDGGSSSASKKRQVVHQVNDSLFELHKPEGTPTMEIVLFHGLNLGESSDAHLSTWEAEDGSIWPQTWLVEEYPAAHIFTVPYSGGVGKTSYEKFDMYIIVENLISDLRDANIGQTPYCPVVLVGHSFGGLVIKQLCLESRKRLLYSREDERARTQSFLYNIKGIFFYGTPHHGSPLISQQAVERKSPLLQYFRILSTEAGRLNAEFDKLRRSYPKWRVGGLGESLPTESGVFQGVVAAAEASSRQGNISKPSSKRDRRFYSLTGLLMDIARNSEDEGRKREETALEEARPQNFQRLPEPMVSIDAQVDQITSKLETVRTLGLAGMGGLGKTTLAMAIFNKLGPSFQYTCFVRDVKLSTGSVYEVKDAVWEHMHCSGKRVGGETNFSLLNGKKLLIVLDDISYRDVEILHNLSNCSGSESRFIATSRDQDLLRSLDAHKAEVHAVPLLNENSAEQLFMKVAFASEAGPPVVLKSLFQAIVKKCDGLPLTLNVLGSHLRQTRSYEHWDQILNALTEAEYVKGLHDKLWKKLRVSYVLLGPTEQQMFLDVCTFFGNSKNWTLYEAKLAWRAAYKPQCERRLWETLVDKSLVYDVKEDENIKVHEQLQSLGRRIASEPNNLGKCRIWNGNMALEMLESEGMFHGKEIHALRLVELEENNSKDGDSGGSESEELEENDSKDDNPNGSESEYSVSNHQLHIGSIALQKLKNAKFLEADVPISMTGLNISQSMSSELVLLKCYGVDLLKLALETSLVVLQLSVEEDLPQSFGKLKVLQSLSLSECSMLEDLPDSFGHLATLSRLQFHNCPKLQTLPDSFGHLATLNHLEFHWCDKLQTLPDSFGHLATLNHLEFHGCTELCTLPDSFGHLATLNHLEFHDCWHLQTLPDSFGHLETLNHLEFHDCRELCSLPDSFGHLASLNHLEFHWSDRLQTLPDSFGHLATLNHLEFRNCHELQTLPDSFGHLVTLNHLEFHWSDRLQTLPDSFGHLATLNHLEFHGCTELCTLPDSFGHLATLNHLEFHDCWHLQTLPDSFGHLETLNHLEFHDCRELCSLPDSFGHLASLNHLEFHWSDRLQTLPDSFGHLATLNHLEFRNCHELQTLPDSFGHLVTLNHLEFHWSDRLQTLPDSFGHLATLNHLEFHWCDKLQTLPDSFGHLATLNHLEFHWSDRLQTLPDSFGHLATLNHLEFHNCHQLQTLPDSFGHLATLNHLEFHGCAELCTLPDSFEHLASLNHLEFHDCWHLQTLPDSFGHLATLNHLEFHGCRELCTLPDSFGHLATTLNHLEFHNCDELQTLPDSFGHVAIVNHVLKWDSGDTECEGDWEEKFRRFTTEVTDEGANGYFVSKIWLSSLDKHQREEVMSVLGGARYFEIYQTRTTMFYERLEDEMQASTICNDSETYNTKATTYVERIQSHFPNSQTNQGETFSRSNKGNAVGEAGSSTASQESGDSLRDDLQSMDIADKVSGVKNATKASPKIHAGCECPLQRLTVSMRREAGPSTSSSQVKVEIPVGKRFKIFTRVDKEISMKTFDFTETGPLEVDVPLTVSTKIGLSCCVTSDHENVRIHFLEIQGEVRVRGDSNRRTNALALKSVRTNVNASINPGPEDICLDIKGNTSPPQWRRVLNDYRPLDNNGQRKGPEDLTWLDLTPKDIKNSISGSKTLELQHHVKNRLKLDLDEDSNRAVLLYFGGSLPVTFEGEILEGLHPNSFLEFDVRHEVEISYNVPCDPHPTADGISIFTERTNEVVEFDCVLEFRTQEFSS